MRGHRLRRERRPRWLQERIDREAELALQLARHGLEPLRRADLEALIERARQARERARATEDPEEIPF